MVEQKDLGRNDLCHCGSGKKYKKCCESKDEQAKHAESEKQWNAAAAKIASDAEKSEKEHPDQPKPPAANTPHVSEHRRQPFVAPKFSMPRRSGGG